MKKKLSFLPLIVVTTLSHSASLEVYRDSAVYTYMPKSLYLGMTEGVKATCNGQPLSLEQKVICHNDERLCRELNALQDTQAVLESLQSNITLLDKITGLYQPATLDAEMTIDAARKISSERAKLVTSYERDKTAFELQKKAFLKQTAATTPLYYSRQCDVPTKLEFPYGSIHFNTFYEADLSPEKRVNVTQHLEVTNRSGVDIAAEDATFYFRKAEHTVRPVHFRPWIIREYQPQPPVPRTQSLMKGSGMMDRSAVGVMAESASVPTAEYLDAREYRVTSLDLPSTGEPVDVRVDSWSADMECGLSVSPYASLSVYEQCTFTPEKQIENHVWKITEGEALISSHAFGEYRDNAYHLYTKTDEDIKVTRKPIVRKQKDTGFFGDTVRKKDGYMLTLTNKSDKSKQLTVTERIPASESEEIKVKLLQIDADKKIDYRLLKEGEIRMEIDLAAGEERRIEVLFEISYDKEKQISY
ncbi:DUF4139 domain-containing protein [Sulfurovum sp.]|jgi:hypothetical protein|uniref:DUF4139 domain-containing protein n=1 Tax=Sulfurovum sp. TaxID=1969726 RepID=UPI002A368253|nr:DUF4139 domain-containing protein [Sulfurovum sp.]MDY0402280.1 DUF4139 domain-containing protein [Sulfurovum sp.]